MAVFRCITARSHPFDDFVTALDQMNGRGLKYAISYDGRTGDKVYGEPLPAYLNLTLIELEAGRSTQATLLGRDEITVESLYLSPALAHGISTSKTATRKRAEQPQTTSFPCVSSSTPAACIVLGTINRKSASIWKRSEAVLYLIESAR